MESKLTKAFRILRRNGYFARQNWKCCQNCGCYALPKDTTNYVFYHKQDAEDLDEHGSCFLAWGGNGNLIVDVLQRCGIQTDWDGSDDSRIKVTLFTMPDGSMLK
jgi:hypothetical protein